MIREIVLDAIRGCPRRCAAAGALLLIALFGFAETSALHRQRVELDNARLERIEDARKAALARIENQKRVDARRAWTDGISSSAATSPAEAVQALRGRIGASGLEVDQIETRGATGGADLSLVDVHVSSHGGYRSVRALLAELESSPRGWSALSYDGSRLDLEVLLPTRGPKGKP